MSIKESIKKNDLLMKIYNNLWPYYCKVFPIAAIKILYKQTFQTKLDLDNPKDLNEKIQWLKAYKYSKDPLVAKCADKYAVREYVVECGCGEILNELYTTYDNADQIIWEELPDKFALKFNRAAGMNIICEDKNKLKKDETLKKVRSWFTKKIGESTCEFHYCNAPKKVICERYIPSLNKLPIDYKIYCLNGEPYLTMVCIDRATKVKFVFMDKEWRRVYIDTPNYSDNIIPPKPKSYSKMLEYASILAKPFPLVRIDFYDLDDKPIFGEMTFTPFGGYVVCMNKQALIEAGQRLQLPAR